MIYLDSPRKVEQGVQVVRVWTDEDHEVLHAAARTAGVSRNCYKPPCLTGAHVATGGYYVVRSPQQVQALLRAGALDVGALPGDMDLSQLLCVAQAVGRARGRPGFCEESEWTKRLKRDWRNLRGVPPQRRW